MKLSVPTNWDIELLEKLKGYAVERIYGALDRTIVGGGRAAWALTKTSKVKVANYVKEAHKLGFKFNYLLNAPCLNKIEHTAKGKKELLKLLAWLMEIQVDEITLTVPFLIEMVKKYFPHFKIHVSTIANVDSMAGAKFFNDLGVECITIDFMQNRNFALLKQLSLKIKCNIQLLVNDICLYGCPFRQYHYNLMGHNSQIDNTDTAVFCDFYCLLKCTHIRYTNPAELLKCRWIRPEDLASYEDIGIKNFKIAGRGESTEWIVNAVKAYSLKKYHGNLIDLITSFETPKIDLNNENLSIQLKQYLPIKKKHINLVALVCKTPPLLCIELIKMYVTARNFSKNLFINNDKLDSFLDFFKDKDCSIDCAACNYCSVWEKKVITIDNKTQAAYIDILSKALNNIIKF